MQMPAHADWTLDRPKGPTPSKVHPPPPNSPAYRCHDILSTFLFLFTTVPIPVTTIIPTLTIHG